MAEQRRALAAMDDAALAGALGDLAAAVAYPSVSAGPSDIAAIVRQRLVAEPPARESIRNPRLDRSPAGPAERPRRDRRDPRPRRDRRRRRAGRCPASGSSSAARRHRPRRRRPRPRPRLAHAARRVDRTRRQPSRGLDDGPRHGRLARRRSPHRRPRPRPPDRPGDRPAGRRLHPREPRRPRLVRAARPAGRPGLRRRAAAQRVPRPRRRRLLPEDPLRAAPRSRR